MTDSDLQRIERELSLKLPADYRSLMLSYPFPPDSFTAENMLPDNAARLLESAGGRDNLPPRSFIIGNDGGEEIYFIDTSRQQSPVFVFDLETGEIKEYAPTLEAYIQKCRDTDAQILRDEEAMAKKKWWQFWK
jgi:hypothetical protein